MKSLRRTKRMKEFKYVVTDPEGIHARPAGILVNRQQDIHHPLKLQKVIKQQMQRESSE
jgi:phosphotransferase system HPr-like phosphotransfer protein